MVPAASAVFDPGRPSAHYPTTDYAPPDPSTPLTSKRNPIQQETKVLLTDTSSTQEAVPFLVRKHPSFFASFATTPRLSYHSDPLDEGLHRRPCNQFFLQPITFADPYPFDTIPDPFVCQTPPEHHGKPEHSNTQAHPLTTTRRPMSKPHRFFLTRWLPESCQLTCFFAFESMVSFLGTNVVIPVAVLKEVQPYSYTCSCSPSFLSNISIPSCCPVTDVNILDHYPSLLAEFSFLSVITESDELEFQVATTVVTQPVSPFDFLHPTVSNPVPWPFPHSPSELIPISTTFTANFKALFAVPQTVKSLRPPPQPPPIFLYPCHLQKRVLTAVG
jgi:hypothetical protein